PWPCPVKLDRRLAGHRGEQLRCRSSRYIPHRSPQAAADLPLCGGAPRALNAFNSLPEVDRLRQTCGLAEERHATEACLAGTEIERQIAARLKKLQELPEAEESLQAFLHTFRPA